MRSMSNLKQTHHRVSSVLKISVETRIVLTSPRGRSQCLDAYGRFSPYTHDPVLTVLGTFIRKIGGFLVDRP